MLKLSMKAAIKPVIDSIKKAEKQISFGAARTLTGAAFAAQKDTKAHLAQKLILRNSWLQRNVWVERATPKKLESRVGFTKRVEWAGILEEGGTRKPRGRNIAVPQAVRKSEKSKVPKRLRPRELMGRKDVFRKVINGIDGIWQTLPNRKLKLLYNFTPTAQYEPRKINFRGIASTAAYKHINRNLSKNIDAAMKSAK